MQLISFVGITLTVTNALNLTEQEQGELCVSVSGNEQPRERSAEVAFAVVQFGSMYTGIIIIIII